MKITTDSYQTSLLFIYLFYCYFFNSFIFFTDINYKPFLPFTPSFLPLFKTHRQIPLHNTPLHLTANPTPHNFFFLFLPLEITKPSFPSLLQFYLPLKPIDRYPFPTHPFTLPSSYITHPTHSQVLFFLFIFTIRTQKPLPSLYPINSPTH